MLHNAVYASVKNTSRFNWLSLKAKLALDIINISGCCFRVVLKNSVQELLLEVWRRLFRG